MPNTYWKAACLGVIAGMRSMGAPALVSAYLVRTQSPALAESPLKWLGTPKVANALRGLALGEIVGDKLPMVPARIAPAPLTARAISGGGSAAALCLAEGKRVEIGAAIGVAAALASSFGFYYLRRWAGQKGAPDPVLGAAEDALAYGVGWNVLTWAGMF